MNAHIFSHPSIIPQFFNGVLVIFVGLLSLQSQIGNLFFQGSDTLVGENLLTRASSCVFLARAVELGDFTLTGT